MTILTAPLEDDGPDQVEAENFIKALTGSPHTEITAQTFTDVAAWREAHANDGVPWRKDRKGRWIDPLAAWRHGALAELRPWLVEMNRRGAGVFFMVNRGDGEGRATENVQGLRALFVDDDSGTLTLDAINLEPSIVVQSKNGKHVYWRVRAGEPLEAFTPAQAALAASLGTDPKVKDLPRVMRLPGFFHMKDPAAPYMVRMLQKSDAIYTAKEILEGNGASVAEEQSAKTATLNGHATGVDAFRRAEAWVAKRDGAEEGGRNAAAYATAAGLRDFGISEDEALDLVRVWNRRNAPPLAGEELTDATANAYQYAKGSPGSKEDRPAPRNGAVREREPGEDDDRDEPDRPRSRPRLSKSYASACAVLREPEKRALVLGAGRLGFNEMTLMPTIDRQSIAPEMISAMRERCERTLRDWNGKPIQFSIENLQAAVLQVAHEKPYHPVREYLAALSWDGTERLVALPDALGVRASPLNGAMLRKFMISAVARALDPGCKVDTTLILVGPQGVGKSRLFRALAGPWFSDTPMTIGDKDSLLVLHAAWIHEWAELESVQRATRAHTVKAFLSSSEDLIRAPYERAPRRYPRACVIVGTTNDEQFLTDPTGGRRYWVIQVTRRIDVAAVEADRDQLWAEAVYAYQAGEPWYLTDGEEKALRHVQRRHEVEDPWEDEILGFAEANPKGVTTAGALDALRVPPAQQTRAAAMRVGAVLTRAGFKKRRGTLTAGKRAWIYVRTGRKAPVISLEVSHA